MTGLAAIISTYWWLFIIALIFVVLLIIGVSGAVSWYFWTCVIQIERETKIAPIAYGDNTRPPDGYWEAVAREEAKRRAG